MKQQNISKPGASSAPACILDDVDFNFISNLSDKAGTARLYQEKNLNCLTQITENLKVQIDINQFERVFDNLIRNAINYSIENSDIIIGARQENDDIIITVSNAIDKNKTYNIDHIFEPFVRLDESRNSKTGGSGLGLAITKKIVELHHGTISAAIDDGRITFTIKLPTVRFL